MLGGAQDAVVGDSRDVMLDGGIDVVHGADRPVHERARGPEGDRKRCSRLVLRPRALELVENGIRHPVLGSREERPLQREFQDIVRGAVASAPQLGRGPPDPRASEDVSRPLWDHPTVPG